mmetsp:Transcript_2397/g.3380  ORF Transcript_2397/g.3380 Transcript_2397/m.3380 type:complete len:93 (+) Transcript_2397:470-748(+)
MLCVPYVTSEKSVIARFKTLAHLHGCIPGVSLQEAPLLSTFLDHDVLATPSMPSSYREQCGLNHTLPKAFSSARKGGILHQFEGESSHQVSP